MRSLPYPITFLPILSDPSNPDYYDSNRARKHDLTTEPQIGTTIRTTPNKLLFNSAQAYKDIHGPKANCYKTIFYKAWRRREENVNTLNCIEVGELFSFGLWAIVRGTRVMLTRRSFTEGCSFEKTADS